jgi:hypothetical protein
VPIRGPDKPEQNLRHIDCALILKRCVTA